MLNSCTNRIWFVIELCEPIRITELELANMELFSNVPKQFRVYASERYLASSPSTNWPAKYLIGTFEAANVRSEQKFSIKDALKSGDMLESSSQVQTNTSEPARQPTILMYAKYVRFEMLSHYGNEHYCPLSLVRIFGTSISDEEEAATAVDSSEHANADTEHLVGLESGRKPTDQTHLDDKQKDHDVHPNQHSGERPDFLNRLVNERAKLFSSSSQFLSNIISTFLAENFNLSKLFTIFSFNGGK